MNSLLIASQNIVFLCTLDNIDVKLTKKASLLIINTSSKILKGFLINSLIKKVKEFQKRQQLDTLEKLTTKNSLLQRQIVRYQESSS